MFPGAGPISRRRRPPSRRPRRLLPARYTRKAWSIHTSGYVAAGRPRKPPKIAAVSPAGQHVLRLHPGPRIDQKGYQHKSFLPILRKHRRSTGRRRIQAAPQNALSGSPGDDPDGGTCNRAVRWNEHGRRDPSSFPRPGRRRGIRIDAWSAAAPGRARKRGFAAA